MSITEQLYKQVSQVCPIVGVSVGRSADRDTWRIDFVESATPEQRAAADTVLKGFDLTAVAQAQTQREQRLAADSQELADARLNSAVTALVDSTPAQLMAWANTNFPTLTPTERARMGMVMSMLAVSMRPQIRA